MKYTIVVGSGRNIYASSIVGAGRSKCSYSGRSRMFPLYVGVKSVIKLNEDLYQQFHTFIPSWQTYGAAT